MVHNLSAKPIWEFKAGDTIYIVDSKVKVGNSTYYAEIIENSNNYITARVLDKNGNVELNGRGEEKIIKSHMTKCALYGLNPKADHAYYHWFKPSGYAIYPFEMEGESNNATVLETHPSYGMIGLHRISGHQPLFGTSIEHRDFFRISIGTASHKRNLNTDWYHKDETLIEVSISANQFMDLITGINRGDGIPCTISYKDGKHIPEPPFVSQVDLYKEEFKKNMNKLAEPIDAKIDMVKKILDGKTITKGDKEEIMVLLNSMTTGLKSTLPFVQSSFAEQMDKTLTETKCAVEAMVTNRIIDAGVKAIQLENKQDLVDMMRLDSNKE